MPNILSCRTASYGKYIATAYEHLAKIGVNYVEIGVPADTDAAKAELAEYGLSAATLQGSCDVSSADIGEAFNIQAEAAAQMGASRVFVSVRADELDRNLVYRRLRAVGDTAAKHGVVVIMETHPDMITNADVALETMQGVDHPNVRVNFDTANIHYYNEAINGIAELRKILAYVEGVHLKDTNGGYQEWHFPTIGEGVVDFGAVLRICNERGFHGPFTIENEGIRGEDFAVEQQHERMAQSVAHLRGLGYDG